MIKLYNTLSRKKEIFKPIKKKQVGLYTCGPTVYDYAHIGNLRSYIFEDVLRRVLEYNGFRLKHVMNITDVGHLTSDADTGMDKVEKGARREKKTPAQITKFYTKAFRRDLANLNIKEPHIWCKATDYIKEMQKMIKTLENKGFTYKTRDGIYFDTSKIKKYGQLARLDIKGLKPGKRVKMGQKRNPTDFALWKFSRTKRLQEWPSPWGVGFPGWHTECVVMSSKHLGKLFDIHTGGIDHIPVHHTNEIAQSQAAFKTNLARFWLHNEFLLIDQKRMGKSKGNQIPLYKLIEKGFNPLAYRYFVLTAHYRSKLNFTWNNLKAAQNALNKLYSAFLKFEPAKIGIGCAEYEKKFLAYINDDLNVPAGLALAWKLIKDRKLPSSSKKQTLLKFDKVFALGLDKLKKERIAIPAKIKRLVKLREKARIKKDFKKADQLRQQIKKMGYLLQDTPTGSTIIQKAK